MKLLGVEVKERGGLYCLGDIYRASGGAEKDKPGHWLKRKQTKELIEICERSAVSKMTQCKNQVLMEVNNGIERNIYANEHIIIAYAAWIDTEFWYCVIDFFVRYRKLFTQQYKSIRHIVPQPGEMRKRFWKVMQDGGLVVKDGCGYRATTYAVENGLARTMDCVNENGEYYTTVEFSDEGIKLWI